MYFDKPYYLAPGKGGAKVYSLLRQALQSTGKVGVATFVMHQRQHVCIVGPQGKSLVLQTLRFADEVLKPTDVAASTSVSAAELSMAKTLIESMSSQLVAEKFKDTYRTDLKKRVQEKVRLKETHVLDVKMPDSQLKPKAEVINLMQALKASLGNLKSTSGKHRVTGAARRSRKQA